MCGQSVHERLCRIGGIVPPLRVWTEEKDEQLKSLYDKDRPTGSLRTATEILGVPYASVAIRASELGLTNPRRPRGFPSPNKGKGKLQNLSQSEARRMLEALKKSRYGVAVVAKRFGWGYRRFSKAMRQFFPDEYEAILESKDRFGVGSLYKYGRQFEYRVMNDLKSRGYFTSRSPRSGGPVDIVAIKVGQVLFVQCKRGGAIERKQRLTLIELAASVGALAIMASAPRGIGIRYQAFREGQRPPFEP